MLAILCTQILGYTIYTVNNRSLNLKWLDSLVQEVNSKDRDFFSPVPTQVANYLRRGIVEPGDKVACIERLNGMHAFWAHLARVRIVAEIQGEDVEKFWGVDDDVKSQVIAALGRTGAKILVFHLPDYVTELGNIDARRIENTRYYFMPLKR